jgi:prepilin-type N-terminal cleavage/methylation domain-containing protein
LHARARLYEWQRSGGKFFTTGSLVAAEDEWTLREMPEFVRHIGRSLPDVFHLSVIDYIDRRYIGIFGALRTIIRNNMKIPSLHRKGFTLVEIMIVVAIIALLAAIAVPGFLRARKRSQASRILNDLRMIDAAVDQYAIETNRSTGNAVNTADWTNYLKKGTSLYNTGTSLLGSAYGVQTVDQIPQVPSADYNVLSDVANTGFWSPYGP